MSNTARVHARFWQAMAERYGRRWTEQYGLESSPAWRELIDKYTPDDVKAALAELPKEAKDFPPTLPQFEAILAKVASRKKVDTTDWVRGYWRSVIVHDVGKMLGYTFESLEPVFAANRETFGRSMRILLDELDTCEKRMGQRTDGLHALCFARCKEIADGHWHLRRVA